MIERNKFRPVMSARELLKELNLSYPKDLMKVLEDLGISYLEKSLSLAIDGALMTPDKVNYGIVINNNINYEGRKRFTIAHEIGHYWITEHQGREYECESKNIGFFNKEKSNFEYEADEFAAEFLMPTELFEKEAGKLECKLSSVELLADKFQTSLVATARKFVKTTLETCCLVLIADKKVVWDIKSDSFKYDLRRKIDDCYAFDILEEGTRAVRDTIASSNWLINYKDDYIYEDVINFTNLNQQLILLSEITD